MPIAQLTVTPLGTATTSLAGTIAKVQEAIRATGIKHQLTPMSTILEGDIGEVMAVVMAAHEAAFQAGHGRVVTSLTIDDRRDKPMTMEGKVEAVLEKLTT